MDNFQRDMLIGSIVGPLRRPYGAARLVEAPADLRAELAVSNTSQRPISAQVHAVQSEFLLSSSPTLRAVDPFYEEQASILVMPGESLYVGRDAMTKGSVSITRARVW